MKDQIEKLGEETLSQLRSASATATLEEIRVRVLGKKGSLSEILRGLGSVAPEQRREIGAIANQWKSKIESELDEKKKSLESVELGKKLQSEKIDITLPSRKIQSGGLHPLTQACDRIVRAFSRLGFEVTTGPEVETEYLNFDAINIPSNHPARDMQDTFFVGPGVVLRTHTSPVQIRTMLQKPWPIRILCPGAVYRCDNDATHSPMFHQVEGLWIDQDVKMSDLRGVLSFFAKEVFGAEAEIRLRPSYFPFVEPGAEVDISCFLCRSGKKPMVENKACAICKGTGWLEILGAGMVHPHLFEAAGYDPKKVTGFAFGIGVERVAMLLHGISNIRHFYSTDTRFLRQF